MERRIGNARRIAWGIGAFACLALAGCAASPKEEEATVALVTKALSPSDREEIVRQSLAILFDERTGSMRVKRPFAAHLSNLNLRGIRLPSLPGIRWIVKSEEEFQKRANESEEFIYFRFSDLRPIASEASNPRARIDFEEIRSLNRASTFRPAYGYGIERTFALSAYRGKKGWRVHAFREGIACG